MDLDELQKEAAICTLCELHKERNVPAFSRGYPKSDIMVLGMCPGPEENKIGVPFVGRAGKVLDEILYTIFTGHSAMRYPNRDAAISNSISNANRVTCKRGIVCSKTSRLSSLIPV